MKYLVDLFAGIKPDRQEKNSLLCPAAILLLLLTLISSMAIGCSTPTVAPTPTATPTPTPAKPANPELIMASTTSTRDSGLMDVLIPIFQQQTGYVMKPVYVGSGAAIIQGQQGNADVLLVHSPAAEVTFMQGGWGINRLLVMHNDYIIVGPASDPAQIKGMTVALDALKKISNAKINFYSRGDNSGTDALEKALWAKLGITVKDGSTTNPSWYIEGGTGTGMLDLLRIASEKNGYTITDRATYLANQSVINNLVIMVQGDPGLLNIYHVIQVNPAKWPNVNAAGGKAFSDFMVSPATQAIIAKFGVDKYGQPLFFPDAGKTEASLGSQ
jgi:tungstate transport system substrate-binding protein